MFHVKHPVLTDLTHLKVPPQLGCRIVQASSPVSRLTDLRKGLLLEYFTVGWNLKEARIMDSRRPLLQLGFFRLRCALGSRFSSSREGVAAETGESFKSSPTFAR